MNSELTIKKETQGEFFKILNGYINSEVLAASCELGLFSVLSQAEAMSLEDIAERLQLPLHSARVLLLACCAIHLIERDADGLYRNTDIARTFLVPESPTCMLAFVRFNDQVQKKCCSRLTESLREGRNVGLDEFPGEGSSLYERLASRPQLEKTFQEGMFEFTRLAGTSLPFPEMAEIKTLLDLGGGVGSVATDLCEKNPNLEVTVADVASVCEVGRKKIADKAVANRIKFVATDFLSQEFPGPTDGILLSHVVEIFSPEEIKELYRKAFAALPIGGRLFVWTLTSSDDETGPFQAAKSSVYFLCAASGRGMTYPGIDHQRWLAEVGFKSVSRKDFAEINHGSFVAIKS